MELFYFAMGIRGLVRHLLGKPDGLAGGGGVRTRASKQQRQLNCSRQAMQSDKRTRHHH